MKHAANFLESVFSLAVFAAIALAVASTTYQLFNPEGGFMLWISQMWEINPVSVITMGGVVLLVKRWLSGVQGSGLADLMFYGAAILGLYYGFSLLMAA